MKLLIERGIPPRLARFARTHGGRAPELSLDIEAITCAPRRQGLEGCA